MAKKFNFSVKVYYEDTDAGGVVYYANYLKFLERARSEAIYSIGFTNSDLLVSQGILLIVKSCNIKYISPAKFEDKLNIVSEVTSFTKTSFIMKQEIFRDKQLISEADIHLVSVNKNGKPYKLPDKLKEKLEN
jgi:acyl-CoA thioester hydrolase|tara:strand:+ start:1246 stop:1644 length:399 start_codon:yes stop_codon:yes gene_type:complete